MRTFVPFTVRMAPLVVFLAGAHAQQPTADYRPIVDANTRFGLKIVRRSAPGLTKNEIVSPIALSSGFALLRNGANQQCAKEIGDTFEFGQSPEQNVNTAYAALLGELLSRPPEIGSSSSTTRSRNTDAGLKPNGLYLANSFWDIGGPQDFSQGFRDVNEHYYHAEVASLPYSRGAVTAINKWAEDKSFGTIPQVVSSVADDDFLFTSLLYFRNHWKQVFLSSDTQANFTLLSGTTKPVQMMKQSGHYMYEQTPEFEAIVLPYIDGRELYIFLPDKACSLRNFEATLTSENWNKWTEAMTSREGTIELPKFRISSKVEARALLTELGAGCAFASLQALNKAVPLVGATLTHAEQSSSLAADELGGEAVVYTGVGGVIGGVPGGALPGYKPPPALSHDR